MDCTWRVVDQKKRPFEICDMPPNKNENDFWRFCSLKNHLFDKKCSIRFRFRFLSNFSQREQEEKRRRIQEASRTTQSNRSESINRSKPDIPTGRNKVSLGPNFSLVLYRQFSCSLVMKHFPEIYFIQLKLFTKICWWSFDRIIYLTQKLSLAVAVSEFIYNLTTIH